MAFVLKIGYRQMVDIKLWAYAEHVNPMPHGGFDVTHHIPMVVHALQPAPDFALGTLGQGFFREGLLYCLAAASQLLQDSNCHKDTS